MGKQRKTRSNSIAVIGLTVLFAVTAVIAIAAQFRTRQQTEAASSVFTGVGKIGSRVNPRTGDGEFYDTATGAKFIPRGANYYRLGQTGQGLWHTTFDTGKYDPTLALTALQTMKAWGYNVVKVQTTDDAGNPNGSGLNMQYVDNVVDFLKKADSNDMYVVLAINGIPFRGGYFTGKFPHEDAKCFAGNQYNWNWYYLSVDGLEIKKNFVTSFVQAIKDRGAPLKTIFSYNLENEIFFSKDMTPLSLSQGRCTAINGVTYDMATEKQQMINAGLVFWINTLTPALKKIDPDTMVSAGSIGLYDPLHWGDPAYKTFDPTWSFLDIADGGSSADYVDLHVYVFQGWNTIADELKSFISDVPIPSKKKPILMGEYGTPNATFTTFADAANGANYLMCASATEYGFDGWVYWTWDTYEQPEYYKMTDNNFYLAKVLSPSQTPDPCAQVPVKTKVKAKTKKTNWNQTHFRMANPLRFEN